jgi:hypothetical protein
MSEPRDETVEQWAARAATMLDADLWRAVDLGGGHPSALRLLQLMVDTAAPAVPPRLLIAALVPHRPAVMREPVRRRG